MKYSILILLAAFVFAGNVHASSGKYVYLGKGCNSCHGDQGQGIDGKGAAVNGQPEADLVASITKFRESKKGQHKSSMSSSDACDVPLSDQDVESIAKWLAKI